MFLFGRPAHRIHPGKLEAGLTGWALQTLMQKVKQMDLFLVPKSTTGVSTKTTKTSFYIGVGE